MAAKKPEEMTRAELLDEVERLRRLDAARPKGELGHSDEPRRELEELLRDTEKMSAIGRLAGAIAHDFNNHLTVILTHTELMREAGSSADTSVHLEEVLHSAERARKLVRQLTTFSRSQPLRVEVVDAGDLLRGMARMLQTVAGERVRLHVTIEGHPLLVRIDPTHFEQVVLNLVANARDALPDGGAIWVKLAPVAGPQQASPLLERGPTVELSVRDDGIGMSEETRQRAFEPFFTTKPRGVGTGIGLATVYALARQHEGVPHIESTIGEGTTVKLTFPRAQAHPSGTRPLEPGRTPARKAATILVVEDQPSIRRLLSRLLERDGHAVLMASSAEEALRIAEQQAFDMLLTDVVMPGASGPELAEQLRQKHPELPVLLTSGADEARTLDERTSFVQKPFRVDHLRKTIQLLLGEAEEEQAS